MIAVLQLLATAAAGVALFRLWRIALPSQLWLQRVVAAGFLVRAIAGQLLFWISWARLPFLPQLQGGNGLWFFGIDAAGYFANASAASSQGLEAIARMPPSQPAVVYAQILALAMGLLGAVTSTGLLLNLFCYLGCVALLRRWTNAALAITALSISPSFVLWSLQPLKDTLFQLLVVAFVCTCGAWTKQPRWWHGASLVLVLAALSGVRWYVGFALLIASVPFLLATARNITALVAAMLLALLLSRAFLAGGRGHVPQPIGALLTPATAFAALSDLPSLIGGQLADARDAFEATGGRTVIQPPPRATRPLAPLTATGDEAQIREVVTRIIDGWNRGEVDAVTAHFDDAPDVEIWNDGKRTAAGPTEVREVYGAIAAATAGEAVTTVADLRVAIDGSTATASARWQRESRAGSVTFALRRSGGRWRVVKQTTNATGGGQAILPVRPGRTDRIVRPPLARGAAAMLLPRAAGESLGLFHIGGGRGFLWLTDVDTLLFDLALILSLFIIGTHFRAARRDPLFWMLVALTLLIGIPLAYTVTNFGTLFRLRETVYLGVILAPAAAIAASARHAPADR